MSNAHCIHRADRIHRAHCIVAGLLVLACLFASLPALGAEGKSSVVNINSANASQLALLPRVGPSVAERIVDYRKQNGPFKKPEDLMLVQGIGEKTFQLLKPYVAVAGETTLKEKVKGARSSSPSKASKSEAKSAAKKESR
ncbi:MAG TPA: helix-hairpin-helix domain-containing protein [Thermoanaerobaculia bacterium]|nr:helix-hairpin-helix domain-containing protein [Thermoanaerobaculia bacterium]